MGDGNDGKKTYNWMENLSLQTNRNLHRFLSIDTRELVTGTHDEDDIELSLGLSLGGRFGTDKTDKKKLIRSSSIATFPIGDDVANDVAEVVAPRHRGLGRTASLPVETEEEWRKRKELQTLRRMAAKRRRSEKQRRDGSATPTTVPGFPKWVPPPRQQAVGRVVVEQFKVVESQGGSSSGGSESVQGSSSCGGASPGSVQSRHEVAGSSGTKGKEKNTCKSSPDERETPSRRQENVEKRRKETGLNSLEDMPCVFTQGDGPNGRRIEGILYRYGKGEEVSIMCVCHGHFLSPAEFVEHAGVADVAHPLKHIVVNPSSNSFL